MTMLTEDFPALAAMRKKLLALSEPEYQAFASRLLPGAERILGVRLPLLRKEAKELAKGNWQAYISQSHRFPGKRYFEEVMLEGMAIGQLKPSHELAPEDIFDLISQFIPTIDNWSVCDSFCAGLKITKQYPKEMLDFLIAYIQSNQEYSVRFAAAMLLGYYLDEEHIDHVLTLLDGIRHPGYYAKMAAAWALSLCYVKFPQKTLSYLQGQNSLDDFTYNKAIQKAIESKKVRREEKEMLRAIKRHTR